MLFQLYGVIKRIERNGDRHTELLRIKFEIPDGPGADTKAIEKAKEILKNLGGNPYCSLNVCSFIVGLRTITRKRIWWQKSATIFLD